MCARLRQIHSTQAVRCRDVYPILAKGDKEVTGRGRGASRGGGLWLCKCTGETNKGKDCVQKVVCTTHPHTPHPQGCVVLLSRHERGASTKDSYVLLLGRCWGRGGGGGVGISTQSAALSCENHLFAEVAHLQVASPGPLPPRTYR